MQVSKHYETPKLTVVSFKVESGFLESNPYSTTSGVNFGGTPETGIITDTPETNKSGLTQYGYDGLFERNQ